ncbi:glycoside hydrolase family 5 protein [Desulfatirhabdium butyrativorans]|uniref:glycoside hydrolase family 5 protein n=1 Tax=Desulfatirhabdium butyrativorans TaxID=340467 RepID=UPI00040A0CF1|nr:glycoside hydrolase family 5 protein [Desulfatirhabdium butyrativorans]
MIASAPFNRPTHLRGVNLGGWLLLEKWMKPSIFEGMAAADETSWCVELGDRAPERLAEHWRTFITREDFAWLAETGIDAVRIPIGHWIFGPPYPYHSSYGANPHPYVEGGIDMLDRAFQWAEALGLLVVIDLHAAPGCQNSFDNGGIKDVCEWHTRAEYVTFSVELLGRLAERYRSSPALCGIQLLNEPRGDIPTPFLKDYYRRCYEVIRKHCEPERVAIIFHDGFRSCSEYIGFMQPPEYQNVIFDIHRYQCFDPNDLAMDIHGHLNKTGNLWRQEAEDMRREFLLPTIVGEWSLGLDLEAGSLWSLGPFDQALRRLDSFQQDAAYRAFGATQLLVFENYYGWFFWSYRTETVPEWCFRECVERGWLPKRYH